MPAKPQAYTKAMLGTWRYERFHVSYLLAWLSGGLLVGLMFGREFNLGANSPILFASLVLVLGALRSRRWWAVFAIITAGLLLGGLRGNDVGMQYDKYKSLVDKPTTVVGVMTGDAQKLEGSRQRITLDKISINDQRYVGEIFVTLYGDDELKRGDTVTVSGTLREAFASYGAAMSGGKIVHVQRGKNIIRDIRERFAETVRQLVIEPMASLGLGFVVGQRSTLPDTLDEQLKIVGLTHIVVASGYNLTILVRFMMRLLSRRSRYLALVCSLVMILGFVLFSGFSPSMNRAVVVTVLSLLAWYVGRRFHPVLLIIFVATATALWTPMYVWADLGWYLSFFAFAGILVIAPLVVRAIYRRRDPSSFEQLVFETMSAEVMALPLIAFSFGTVPVFGLVANVLVAPFIPAAMALTALTGFVGMISLQLATIFALPTTILIGYMIAIVEWLSSFDFAQFSFDFGLTPLLVWYCMLAIAAFIVQRKLRYNFRQQDQKLDI